MTLENRNVLLESPWIWVLEKSENPVSYFYVEFSILVKQFAKDIIKQCTHLHSTPPHSPPIIPNHSHLPKNIFPSTSTHPK